jgi:hypothetical protein
VSKADQFGKGATRFFPTDRSNPHCLRRQPADVRFRTFRGETVRRDVRRSEQ